MKRDAMRGLIVAMALLATAQTAQAEDWRITVGVSGLRSADAGLLAVSDGEWVNGGDFGFVGHVALGLSFGARVRGMAARSPAGDSEQTASVGLLDLVAVGRWNADVLEWLRPFVEIEVGASRGEVHFDRLGIEADAWGAMAGGIAGIEFRLPPGLLFGGEFSMGLDVGAGYGWRSRFDFDADGVDLGSLDLHGAQVRVAVTAMW